MTSTKSTKIIPGELSAMAGAGISLYTKSEQILFILDTIAMLVRGAIGRGIT